MVERQLLSRILGLVLIAAMNFACTKAQPEFTEFASSIRNPTFNSSNFKALSIPDSNASVFVPGECDVHSISLEMSSDGGVNWASNNFSDSDCSDGTFSIYSPDISGMISINNGSSGQILVRAQTTLGPTNSATLDLRNYPPNIFISSPTVNEGGTLSFTISIDAESSANVNFTASTTPTTATSAVDYSPFSSVIALAAGQMKTTILVPTTEDTLFETNETLSLDLTGITNALPSSLAGIGTINNNDSPPKIFVFGTSLAEGNASSVTVSLSEVSGVNVTGNYTTYDGSATTGLGDFSPYSNQAFIVPAGSWGAGVSIDALDDTLYENTETYTISLDSLTGVQLSGSNLVGSVTILSTDPPPDLAISDSSDPEGSPNVFVINLSAMSEVPVVFNWITYFGSATAADFSPIVLSTRTIPTLTASVSLTVPTIQDNLDELDETYTVSLSNIVNASGIINVATGTIMDDDGLPNLFISDADPVTEGETAFFTVSISTISGLDVSFTYQSADDTAISGWDYNAVTPQVATVSAGSLSTTVKLISINDTRDEIATKYAKMIISAPTNANILNSWGQAPINDNDDPPGITIFDVSGNEGEDFDFTVSLSAASELNVDFFYTTNDGSASAPGDYGSFSNPRTILAGGITTFIRIYTNADGVYESTETFTLDLSAPVNASFIDDSAIGTISNLNPPPSMTAFPENNLGNEGDDAVFIVSLSGLSEVPATFSWTTTTAITSFPAVEDQDFPSTSEPNRTISAGDWTAEITVPTYDDLKFEPTPEDLEVVITPDPTFGGELRPSLQLLDDESQNPALNINSGIDYTKVTSVTLAITDPGPDAFEMYIANDPSCSGGSWEPISSSKPSWAISSGDGLKQISVKFRTDVASGSLESDCVSDSITLDQTGPLAPSWASFSDFQNAINTASPALDFSYEGDAGVGEDLSKTQARILRADDGTALTEWTSVTQGNPMAATNLEHGREYFAQIRSYDLLGNVSSISRSPLWRAISPSTYTVDFVKDVTISSESVGSINIEVTITPTPSFDVTISFNSVANKDYGAGTYQFDDGHGELVISSGNSTANKVINIANDIADNGPLEIKLALVSALPRQVGIGDHSVQQVIVQDDDGTLESLNQIAAGPTATHACATIGSGNDLRCWGQNSWGQVGNGSSTILPVSNPAAIDTNIYEVSTGGFHTCAISGNDSQKVKCWGQNSNGQLGIGNLTSKSTPTLYSGSINMSLVAAGQFHTCAADSSLTYCWGLNSSGQLGLGNTTTQVSPVLVSSAGDATSLSLGASHSCMTFRDSYSKQGVNCWGLNSSGQLGDGTTTTRTSPVSVSGYSASLLFTNLKVAVGANHSCVADLGLINSVNCWGDNSAGQVGANSSTTSFLSPQSVVGLPNTIGTNIDDLVSGSRFSCVTIGISPPFDVYCWGYNSGQFGTGVYAAVVKSAVKLPIKADKIFAVGENLFVKNSGAFGDQILAAGSNDKGVIPGGATDLRLRPETHIVSNAEFSHVSNGDKGGCGITQAGTNPWGSASPAGRLLCWGYNNFTIGDGRNENRHAPIEIDPGVSYQSVSRGTDYTCAITSSGRLKCWGNGGAIGSSRSDRSFPSHVKYGTYFSKVSARKSVTCAAQMAGTTIYCFGDNTYGQLAQGLSSGTLPNSAEPMALDNPFGSSAVTDISVGDYHVCALSATGDVKCWGKNNFGQLGLNANSGNQTNIGDQSGETGTGIASPILGGAVSSIASGADHSCVVRTSDGFLFCWGLNTNGQLGVGSNDSYRIYPSGVTTNYSKIAAGTVHTCGILNDNSVKCWGLNAFGQLGTSNKTGSNYPLTLSLSNFGGSLVRSIQPGFNSTCAIDGNDQIKCWGSNGSQGQGLYTGALGTGDNTSYFKSAMPITY